MDREIGISGDWWKIEKLGHQEISEGLEKWNIRNEKLGCQKVGER